MIESCMQHVANKLSVLDVREIYNKPEDAARHKGSRYALLLEDEPEQNQYDGSKIAYIDDIVNRVRTYHIRQYVTTATLEVRLIEKTSAAATILKNMFMATLGKAFADPDDYEIEVIAGAAKLITDKSILTSGVGYSVVLTFTGGIYSTKQVMLLGEIAPEGEIVKEV